MLPPPRPVTVLRAVASIAQYVGRQLLVGTVTAHPGTHTGAAREAAL